MSKVISSVFNALFLIIFLAACNSEEELSSQDSDIAAKRLYIKQLDQHKTKNNNRNLVNSNNKDNIVENDRNSSTPNINYLEINDTYPIANDQAAFINGSVRLSFSEILVKSTVKKSQFQFTSSNGENVIFDLDIIGNRVYLVSEMPKLNCGQNYFLKVSPGIRSISNNVLRGDFNLRFKTMSLMICG